jgi:hypothetical protein
MRNRPKVTTSDIWREWRAVTGAFGPYEFRPEDAQVSKPSDVPDELAAESTTIPEGWMLVQKQSLYTVLDIDRGTLLSMLKTQRIPNRTGTSSHNCWIDPGALDLSDSDLDRLRKTGKKRGKNAD